MLFSCSHLFSSIFSHSISLTHHRFSLDLFCYKNALFSFFLFSDRLDIVLWRLELQTSFTNFSNLLPVEPSLKGFYEQISFWYQLELWEGWKGNHGRYPSANAFSREVWVASGEDVAMLSANRRKLLECCVFGGSGFGIFHVTIRRGLGELILPEIYTVLVI